MTEVVVVTGAGGALGSAVVAEFLAAGQEVVAVRAHPPRDGGGPAARVHHVTADLADRSAVRAAWERIDGYGTPRALVNVAGGFAPGSLADTDERTLRAMLDINVATTLWSCQAAAPGLQAR